MWIKIARSPGLPGDRDMMCVGYETEIYNVLASVCGLRNRSNKTLRLDIAYAWSRLQRLLKSQDPNKAVRVIRCDDGWRCEHVVWLLVRRLQDSSSRYSKRDRQANYLSEFIKGSIAIMIRSGLKLTTSFPPNCGVSLYEYGAVCFIQNRWRFLKSRERKHAALLIQASWRGYSYRKNILHNPHTSVGNAWLTMQAIRECG